MRITKPTKREDIFLLLLLRDDLLSEESFMTGKLYTRLLGLVRERLYDVCSKLQKGQQVATRLYFGLAGLRRSLLRVEEVVKSLEGKLMDAKGTTGLFSDRRMSRTGKQLRAQHEALRGVVGLMKGRHNELFALFAPLRRLAAEYARVLQVTKGFLKSQDEESCSWSHKFEEDVGKFQERAAFVKNVNVGGVVGCEDEVGLKRQGWKVFGEEWLEPFVKGREMNG